MTLERLKGQSEYVSLMSSLLSQKEPFDSPTINEQAKSRFISSVKLPLPGSIVIFEPHKPYSVPTNYFQGLNVDGIQLEDNFTSGSFRGLVFFGESILLLSTHVINRAGKDHALHYIAVHFSKKELKIQKSGSDIAISFSGEKSAKSILSKEVSKHSIKFTFSHARMENRLITPEKAMDSDMIKNYVKRFGDANSYITSSKMMGFTVTTPFILPHPYAFRFLKEIGFQTRAEMAFQSEKEFEGLLFPEKEIPIA
jgi:hypothetical protein